MVKILHEFYERATEYAYPIVTHTFQGMTLQEAQQYFRAHMKYDRLLRASTISLDAQNTSGVFERITYRAVVRIVL